MYPAIGRWRLRRGDVGASRERVAATTSTGRGLYVHAGVHGCIHIEGGGLYRGKSEACRLAESRWCLYKYLRNGTLLRQACHPAGVDPSLFRLSRYGRSPKNIRILSFVFVLAAHNIAYDCC